MAKYIIDVSVHNGVIDWNRAKKVIDGAIIRIGYGDDVIGQDDTRAVYNIDECERLGIPYGVYLYSYANNSAHVKSEVAHMQRMILGRKVTGGIWLDLEERNYRGTWREAAEAWLKAFPEQGGVYSWKWCFTDVLSGIDCPRWVCAYGTNDGTVQPAYKPDIEMDGWQYTSRAKVSGISGNVDMSEWYADFGTASKTTPEQPAEPEKDTRPIYEVSGTVVPSKVSVKWGLLKNGQKVTPRMQPDESASPTGFSPVQPLTRIDVCDYITTEKRWAYCRVNGLYGFILASSIRDYLRTPGARMDKVVDWVMADDFGTLETRENALRTLGYDVDDVQDAVNDRLGYEPPETPTGARIRVWPIWFFEKDESKYGDCTAILEYDAKGVVIHCVLIDAAMSGASSVVISKLQKAGVKRIDAFVLSHGHGDHYGGLSKIMAKIPVSHIYVPDVTELAKYQSSYASAIKSQAKKASSTYLKAGSGFSVGGIKCKCLYICPANKLTEHDDHHFVNNESMVLRFTLNDTWTFHTAGDLQNAGNNLLIKAVDDLRADIFKAQWHGDANATNEAIAKAVRPKVAFSNYHHTERSGRSTTRKRLEAVGATVARNAENGDIYIDCVGKTMTLTCSKGNLSKSWSK